MNEPQQNVAPRRPGPPRLPVTAAPAPRLGPLARARPPAARFARAAGGVLALAASAAFAASGHAGGDIVIERPYASATPPGVAMAAGYLGITNHGDEDERLIGGTASFASGVEVHRTVVVDDIVRMRELEDGLVVPAGETVELVPGGTHLMFVGLDGALLEGGRHVATLRFERAGEIEVTFTVERLTGSTKGMIDHREMKGDPESSEGR